MEGLMVTGPKYAESPRILGDNANVGTGRMMLLILVFIVVAGSAFHFAF
jgi:hypothetical protein